MFQDFQRPKSPNCEFLENKNQVKYFHQIMKQKAFLFINESIGMQQISNHTKAKQNSTHMKLKLTIPMLASGVCNVVCCAAKKLKNHICSTTSTFPWS